MNEQCVKIWKEARDARIKAQEWNGLPFGEKYTPQDTFAISKAHCTAPVLVRAGQKHCGGTNYWNTEKEFNNAIRDFLVDNWDAIYPKVIARMQAKEDQALLDCQEYIDQLQSLINNVQESK